MLTRAPSGVSAASDAKEVAWDAKSFGDWTKFVDGADVVINLVGKSVDCRYNEPNRKAIIASRVDSTHVLGEAIAQCKQPPRVWLNCSSATIYKHAFDTPMDEAGETGATREAKDEFSIEVIRQWERALDEAQTPDTRKVAMRITMVFGKGRRRVPRAAKACAVRAWRQNGQRQAIRFMDSCGMIFCARLKWLIRQR